MEIKFYPYPPTEEVEKDPLPSENVRKNRQEAKTSQVRIEIENTDPLRELVATGYQNLADAAALNNRLEEITERLASNMVSTDAVFQYKTYFTQTSQEIARLFANTPFFNQEALRLDEEAVAFTEEGPVQAIIPKTMEAFEHLRGHYMETVPEILNKTETAYQLATDRIDLEYYEDEETPAPTFDSLREELKRAVGEAQFSLQTVRNNLGQISSKHRLFFDELKAHQQESLPSPETWTATKRVLDQMGQMVAAHHPFASTHLLELL